MKTTPMLRTLQQNQLANGRQALRDAVATVWSTTSIAPDTTEVINLQTYDGTAPRLIELTHLMALTDGGEGLTYQWPVVLILGNWPTTAVGDPFGQELLDAMAQLQAAVDQTQVPDLVLTDLQGWMGLHSVKQVTGWPPTETAPMMQYYGLMANVSCTVAN